MNGIFDIDPQKNEFDYSAERYLKDGTTLPDSGFEELRDNHDAIYLGALGDPRVPDMKHAKDNSTSFKVLRIEVNKEMRGSHF